MAYTYTPNKTFFFAVSVLPALLPTHLPFSAALQTTHRLKRPGHAESLMHWRHTARLSRQPSSLEAALEGLSHHGHTGNCNRPE